MADQPDVRPGQVWADNDARGEGRTLKVLRVECRPYLASTGRWRRELAEADFALCQVITERVGTIKATVGRKVWLRCDRLRPTSTGYRLVSDAPEVSTDV